MFFTKTMKNDQTLAVNCCIIWFREAFSIRVSMRPNPAFLFTLSEKLR